jgi:hypothetical protein
LPIQTKNKNTTFSGGILFFGEGGESYTDLPIFPCVTNLPPFAQA